MFCGKILVPWLASRTQGKRRRKKKEWEKKVHTKKRTERDKKKKKMRPTKFRKWTRCQMCRLFFASTPPPIFHISWWPGDGRHGCWDRLSKTPQFKLMPELQNRTRKPRNVCHFYQNNNLKTLAYTSLNELEWFWMTEEYYTSIIPRVKRGRHRSW